ncbi:MAG: type II toxin-antitoxin system VapC family toxin [Gammaproteobacteria bacterium]|nr:type II toxin-antitoxin system VapC family toxin [Gammaproteobacteria bacterium]
MAKRDEAYVDTSALIAFTDQSDTYHALFARLFANPPRLVTTSLVIAEGHGWFLRRYDRYKAMQFLGLIEALTPMSVVSVSRRDRQASFGLIRHYSDQNLTLADAVGLQVMETRGVGSCWSTDFHLGITGVPLAIHEH